MTQHTQDTQDGEIEREAETPPTRDRVHERGTTYERLKQDIVVGALPPGAPLVETLLAERYNVSRTPIREALRRLEQEDLVERVDRTMRVRQHTPQEVFELYEVRMILEGAATRAAAERRTDFDIAQMKSLLRRMESPSVPLADRVQLNREFHTVIWRASHNRMLSETIERLYTTSVRYPKTTLTDDERWEESHQEHREVLEAIISGNGDEAERVIRKHLQEARDIRLGFVTTEGAGSA